MDFPFKLNPIHTLAFGAVVLYLGYLLRRVIPVLARYNLPAPVLGGLLVAGGVLAWQQWNTQPLLQFDTSLREPLMVAFFTTIGFGASVGLLKKGGPMVVLFLVLSTVAAILQNVVGAAAAVSMGQEPLLGVLCGSVTLTGGPATGVAFASQFEKAGVAGAEALAVAAAMLGIVCGGLIGGPIGTFLVDRRKKQAANGTESSVQTAEQVVERELPGPVETVPMGEDARSYVLLKSIGIILVAMWIGTWVSQMLGSFGVTLPSYIGAMLVAAALRNLDDLTGWIGLSQEALDEMGNIALAFFLVIAMMTLELSKLAHVAVPLLVILAVQVALVALLCLWPLFTLMGRDYESGVMASGFCGFMLGTTANAMANMDALTRRYGPAPKAFLIVPMVGAFFIDFANALLIQGSLNLFAMSP